MMGAQGKEHREKTVVRGNCKLCSLLGSLCLFCWFSHKEGTQVSFCLCSTSSLFHCVFLSCDTSSRRSTHEREDEKSHFFLEKQMMIVIFMALSDKEDVCQW